MNTISRLEGEEEHGGLAVNTTVSKEEGGMAGYGGNHVEEGEGDRLD